MAIGPVNWDKVFTDQSKVGLEHYRRIPYGQPLLDDHLRYVKDEGHSDQWQNIEFVRQLGSGSFGTVWEVTTRQKLKKDGLRKIMFWQKWENLRLACKVMTYFYNGRGNIRSCVNILLADMQRLQFLKHDNIVKYVDFIGIPDPLTGFPYSRVLMLMELCNGDINSFIRSTNYMSEKEIVKWLRHIAKALVYLHNDNRMVHLDIKPLNILYKNRFGGKRIYKLGDFGLAIAYEPGQPMEETNFPGGTTAYVAPEFFPAPGQRHGPIGQLGKTVTTPPCDIYSAGATVVNCLIGNTFYRGRNARNQLHQLASSVSPEFRQLIDEMLAVDPQQRPDAQTLLHRIRQL
ncbi:uncharacterized protein LOC128964938 [Oppia nitens]|uniref:uncharacterized protein LOC128964938 n=1 Tax=Oppia nitens TaxID=1686743 RepID=UPI0023DBCBC5|nr:uncharacterized protein LOC128964938 [Oppia nitens]